MTATTTPARLRAAAIATFLVFGINGVVFASWAARIPAVTETLDLTPDQMGTLLLCIGGGSIVGLPAAGLSTIGVGLPAHLLAIAALVAIATILIPRYFLAHVPEAQPASDDAPAPKTRSAWTDRRTLLIGVVVLGATITEGSGNDWIAKAAVDGLDFSESNGALMFAVFGLTTFVFAQNLWTALPGVALWGIGAALAFPIGMSAAADDPKRAAARVSVVSTLGYVAFLVGPPLLGFLGDLNGIRMALLAIIIPIVGALLLSGAAKPLPKK